MDADLFTDPPAPARLGWGRALLERLRHLRLPAWLRTLKARLAIGGTAALILGGACTAWQLGEHAERDLMAQAQARERAMALQAADLIGRRLQQLQELLAHVAVGLDASLFDDPPRLAVALQASALLGADFATVYSARPDGRLLAFVDAGGARFPATSLHDRDYFRQAVGTGQPVISRPLPGRFSDEPIVVFSHPVLRDGALVGVIGGSLRLASRDLAHDMAGVRADGDETLVVVTDARGTVLSHPEHRFVFRPVDEEPRLAAAWRRSHVDLAANRAPVATWSDAQSIVSVAVDARSGWRVWRQTPRDTLLAPVHQARDQTLADAALLVLVMSVALVVFLVWQLRPLARLERRAAALLTGDATGEWPQAQGEIGRLARTLQHVWAERSQMESFNQQVLQKLGSVMAAAPVGLTFTRNQCFELVSAEFCHLLGYAEADILGQRAQVIFASNQDYARLGTAVGQAFAAEQPYAGEWQLLRADGERFWGLLRARPVQAGDPAAGTIWSINDVTEQVQARRELEHAARHDALTGVVNRQGFEHAIQELFDHQPGSRPAALVMIDLDHFKPINDTAGHAAGDAMLVAVAQTIASRVRATDLVVRLGGDEFALLLASCNHDRALSVAEKVREAITDLALTWEAHTLRVGASLGVAELAEHHESPAQWLAQADAACYEAKRAGRGTVRMARNNLRVIGGAG
jgi:diguanylate cyclase (GGDEF)-like protein/PAS domain S-box-containing protein